MIAHLLDGTTVEITSRKQVEDLWRDNKISLHEAASVLTNFFHLHPSHAPKIWAYLENLR